MEAFLHQVYFINFHLLRKYLNLHWYSKLLLFIDNYKVTKHITSKKLQFTMSILLIPFTWRAKIAMLTNPMPRHCSIFDGCSVIVMINYVFLDSINMAETAEGLDSSVHSKNRRYLFWSIFWTKRDTGKETGVSSWHGPVQHVAVS